MHTVCTFYIYISKVFKEQFMSFKSETKPSFMPVFIIKLNMPPAKCLCVLQNMLQSTSFIHKHKDGHSS